MSQTFQCDYVTTEPGGRKKKKSPLSDYWIGNLTRGARNFDLEGYQSGDIPLRELPLVTLRLLLKNRLAFTSGEKKRTEIFSQPIEGQTSLTLTFL